MFNPVPKWCCNEGHDCVSFNSLPKRTSRTMWRTHIFQSGAPSKSISNFSSPIVISLIMTVWMFLSDVFFCQRKIFRKADMGLLFENPNTESLSKKWCVTHTVPYMHTPPSPFQKSNQSRCAKIVPMEVPNNPSARSYNKKSIG